MAILLFLFILTHWRPFASHFGCRSGRNAPKISVEQRM
jgi:hypothetical protein